MLSETWRLIVILSSVVMRPMWTVAAAAKSLQLCVTLCDPIDGSPPGSPVPGILQARTLEWVPCGLLYIIFAWVAMPSSSTHSPIFSFI